MSRASLLLNSEFAFPHPAEAMFRPLEDTVALLTRFGEQLDSELVKKLEDGPRQWRLLCKKMFRWEVVL